MSTNNESEIITLKDVLQYIIRVYKVLWNNKFLIIFLSLLIATAYVFFTWDEKPKYSEKLTFMMDEDQGNPLQGFSLFDVFGKGGKTNTGEKLLKLFESKKILHTTLFDTISYNGKTMFLANYILETHTMEELCKPYRYFGYISFKEQWPKILLESPPFRFTNGNINDFNRTENQYLRLIYEFISGNENVGLTPKLVSSLDKDSGIMSLSMASQDESLTLSILNNIYGHLSVFFIDKSIEKQAKTFRIMNDKRDSITYALKRAEYRLADFKDRNRNLVTVKGYLDQTKMEREIYILNSMYGEAVKQMELTDFALKNKTPIIQVIDLPRAPIVPSKKSFKKISLFGFVLGLLFTSMLILIIKYIKDLFAQEQV
jgi:hypothetical protein